MTMKTTLNAVFGIASALLIAGCGASNVREVRAPKQKLTTKEPRRVFDGELAPRDQILLNNKIFLWPYGMSQQNVSTALQMAREIDGIDTEQFLVGRQIETVRQGMSQIDQIRQRITRLNQERAQARIRIRNSTRERDTAQAELTRAQQAGDPVAIRDWEGKLQAAQQKLAEATALQTNAERELPLAEEELRKVTASVDPQGKMGDELTALTGRAASIVEKGRVATAALTRVVELDEDGPTLVRFDLESDGGLDIRLQNWAPGNLVSRGIFMPKRNFSTDDGTITAAKYDPVGGRVEFEVTVYENELRTEIQAVYKFKLARTEYSKTDDPTDGRIFYQGDVWRESSKVGPLCSPEEERETRCRRKGSAKFVSGNSQG
jgi:hypothetical protein